MKKIKLAFKSLWFSFLLFLPDEYSKFRVKYYNSKGCRIHRKTSISPNVRIRGKFEMDEGSSIAQNCSISGESVGVYIGKNVMIAPNVGIFSSNHCCNQIDAIMIKQRNTEVSVYFEDNIWIASNCRIIKDLRIRKGSIIATNSFINRYIPVYSIAGGVPKKICKARS
jgi:acetyltransferase-like isoleucine patch superfamily enzyme